jgi:hypothetical protein
LVFMAKRGEYWLVEITQMRRALGMSMFFAVAMGIVIRCF